MKAKILSPDENPVHLVVSSSNVAGEYAYTRSIPDI